MQNCGYIADKEGSSERGQEEMDGVEMGGVKGETDERSRQIQVGR